jgi:hypothetical protein
MVDKRLTNLIDHSHRHSFYRIIVGRCNPKGYYSRSLAFVDCDTYGSFERCVKLVLSWRLGVVSVLEWANRPSAGL